jgi:hypothetical protein
MIQQNRLKCSNTAFKKTPWPCHQRGDDKARAPPSGRRETRQKQRRFYFFFSFNFSTAKIGVGGAKQ